MQKLWAEHTFHADNAYPTYRRRNNGKKVIVQGHELDNRWMVPHNPYLVAKFNCHIKVEIYSTVKTVKYIYKGHDRIHFQANSIDRNTAVDEIIECCQKHFGGKSL